MQSSVTNQERIMYHNNRLEAMKETVAGLPDAGGDTELCVAYLHYNPNYTASRIIIFPKNCTWAEFCDSVYNTYSPDNYIGGTEGAYYHFLFASNGGVYSRADSFWAVSTDGTSAGMVSPTDTIIEGYYYGMYDTD